MRRIRGGLVSGLPARDAARPPTAVFEAVATATPLPLPDTTMVPAKAMFSLSPSGVLRSRIRSGSLASGIDSPVSRDSSTTRSWTSISLISAGTFPPDSRRTISPGTSSSESISNSSPPRITRVLVRTIFFNASALFSAEYSWMVPMIELSSSTIMINMLSCQSPSNREIAAARRRM